MARKKVNWNGFTVANCKTMNGTDGYVLSCDIKFNGKTVAHFFDGGYGGEAEIWTEAGFSRKKLEEAVKGFKEAEVSEFGFVHEFDLATMCYQMMDAEDLSKAIFKAREKGYAIAFVERKNNMTTLSYNVPMHWADDVATSRLIGKVGEQFVKSVKIYRDETELDLNNKVITLADIAC